MSGAPPYAEDARAARRTPHLGTLALRLPVVVFATATLLVAMLLFYAHNLLAAKLGEAAIEQSRALLFGLRGFLENDARHETTDHVERYLCALAHDLPLRVIAIVDAAGQVRIATRDAWRGRPAASVLRAFDIEGLPGAGRFVVSADGGGVRAAIPLRSALAWAAADPRPGGYVYLDYDLTPTRRALRQGLLQAGVALWIAALAATLALVLALRRALSTPLHEFAAAAERLGQGEYDAALPVSDLSELRILAAAFEKMRRRIAESLASLLASETRHRALLDSAPDPIVTIDAANRIVAYNRAAEETFGYPAGEMIGRSLDVLIPAPDRARHAARVAGYRGGAASLIVGQTRELEALTRDGSTLPVAISVSEVVLDGERYFTAIVKDIRERRRASETARRNLNRQAALIRLLALPIHGEALDAILNEALGIVLGAADTGLCRSGRIYLDDRSGGFRLAAAYAAATTDDAAAPRPGGGRCGCGEPLAATAAVHRPAPGAAGDRFGPHWAVVLRLEQDPLGVLIAGAAPGADGDAEAAGYLDAVAQTLGRLIDRKRARDAIHMTAEAVAGEADDCFMSRLVEAAARALGTDACFIGILEDSRAELAVPARVLDGTVAADRVHPLAGTACEDVITAGDAVHAQGVCRAFPGMAAHWGFAVEGYVGVSLRDDAGTVIGVLAVLSRRAIANPDQTLTLLRIFATRAAHELVRRRQLADLRLAAHAFETMEGIFVTDPHGVVLRVNRAFTDILGYAPEEVLGRTPALWNSPRHDDHFIGRLGHETAGSGWHGEIWARHKSGVEVPLWETVSVVRDEGGAITHYVSAMLDMTERKAFEARIERLAYYDELTGLPNRRLFANRMEQALALAGRHAYHGALLFVDLDHFKNINDALGHAIGDALLAEVGRRLQRHLRRGDTVARLGGDEFVILLANLGAAEIAAAQARTVAEKVLETLNEPYDLAGHLYYVSPSIGITLFPEGEETSDDLLKRADTAMYRAKAQGRNQISFYEPHMQAAAEQRLALEKDLRQAVVRDELFVVCQPQVDARGEIVGVEALLRWNHPARGLVGPGRFIPIAEETGLITVIGDWVLEAALRAFATFAAGRGGAGLGLSINVSVRQFARQDFVSRVIAAAARAGVPLFRLTLELTEGIFIENVTDTIGKMEALKRDGVRFSIDDFGTGYSSLSYLKRLPIDEIKIDRSFVMDVTRDVNDAAIVESVIAVARHMRLMVVAEGVETQAQWAFLRERGCGRFQGFLFARPLSVAALAATLDRGEALGGDPGADPPG